MPIANVDLTNSLEYFIMVTNQLVTAVNYLYANNVIAPTITINPNTAGLSLNVANGLIYGNSSRIFGIPASAFSVGRVDQIQNTSISIVTSNGIVANASTLFLANSVWINVDVVDSVTNTRTNLPLAANAIGTLITALKAVTANANSRTTGAFPQPFGGLTFTSYADGEILIGNGVSRLLEKNTVPSRLGVEVTTSPGTTSLRANVAAGSDIAFEYLNGGGIRISQNGTVVATSTTNGIIQLSDTTQSKSIDVAATANALNAMAQILVNTLIAGQGAGDGRLIRIDAYRDTGSHTWNKPANTNVAFIIVECLGAGGAGGEAQGNSSTNIGGWVVASTGGGAGGYIKGRILNPANSYNVVVGSAGTANAEGGSTNTVTILTPSSGTTAIPTNATQMVIEIWGAGGSGGQVGSGTAGGGGGGGYAKRTLALSAGNWGQTLSYTVGLRGIRTTGDTNGTAGTQTNVTSGTYSITSLTAGGGQGGGGGTGFGKLGGAAGSGSGGDTNSTGTAGQDGDNDGTPFWSGDGGNAAGSGGLGGAGFDANSGGAGGGGGGPDNPDGDPGLSTQGGQGGNGEVKIVYTIASTLRANNGASGTASIFGDNLFIANGGSGGANSRSFPAASPNTTLGKFGRVCVNPTGLGLGGPVSNSGSTIVDIAARGGNSSPIVVLMGNRRVVGGTVGSVIGSEGGSPLVGGSGGSKQISDIDEQSPGNTFNLDAPSSGGGGAGYVHANGTLFTASAGSGENGYVIVYTYSAD